MASPGALCEEFVDTHFHIWELDRFKYPWPTPDNSVLYKDFTAENYDEARKNSSVRYGVFVQVLNQNTEEIDWVLDLAKQHTSIKGVVGGLDLTSPDLGKHLDKYCRHPSFVGVRHILDFEEENWITTSDVLQGLSLLEERGLTYDLLLRPHHLKYIPSVVGRFPRLKFVVNHIAKPFIKDGKIEGWKEGMTAIAKHPNVYCKISGLVTEADHNNWKKEDFLVYVKHIIDIFGEDRCMFGSDYPVFYQATPDYGSVVDLAMWLLSSSGVSDEGKKKIFGKNAISFYNLKMG